MSATEQCNKDAVAGRMRRLVRSWLVGSGSTEPCRTTRLCQNLPDPASELFELAEIGPRRVRWECLSACLQITSGRLQENLAQRRKDAKCGFPQFIPLFLCALAALREALFFPTSKELTQRYQFFLFTWSLDIGSWILDVENLLGGLNIQYPISNIQYPISKYKNWRCGDISFSYSL